MKTQSTIESIHDKLGRAAMFADRNGDKESYEVLANCAMALGWVLDRPEFLEPFEELIKGPNWAANGGEHVN